MMLLKIIAESSMRAMLFTAVAAICFFPTSQVSVAAADHTNSAATVRKNQENIGRFLWLSDIHLDPYYGTSNAIGRTGATCNTATASAYGQLGCDSPFMLVHEALRQAATMMTQSSQDGSSNGLDFAIVTGDVCRHGNDLLKPNPVNATQAILANVSQLLRSTFDSNDSDPFSIVPSLGNNDFTPDYYLDVDNPDELLEMVTNGFDALLLPQGSSNNDDNDERSSFRQGGYLARLVTNNIAVISLNTIIYSLSHTPLNIDDDPLNQFAWLEQKLEAAKLGGTLVYIIGHIPPAMGSFRHTQLWQTSYVKRYYELLADYVEVVAGQFFGHLHSDEFRLIPSSGKAGSPSNSSWPLWLAASITPIYGSNPSIRIVSYSRSDGALLDYDTYYLPLLGKQMEGGGAADSTPEWIEGPSFLQSFGLEDMSVASLQTLIGRLNESMSDPESSVWQTMLARQHVHADDIDEVPCSDLACRQAWMCFISTLTSAEFNKCLVLYQGVNPAWATLTKLTRLERWAVVASGLSIVVVIILCWRRCLLGRRQHYQQAADLLPEFELPEPPTITVIEATDTTTTPGGSVESNRLPELS